MNYMTPKEAAEKWGISQRRVHTLCQQNRILNAERHGWTWLIPEASEKPNDLRVKSGRYLKSKRDLSVPIAGGAIISRYHLVEKFCPTGSKLTYIHANAGYGKTTLMLQYAKGRTDVVWLALDDNDNDMIHFLHHLEVTIRKRLGQFKFEAMSYIPFINGNTFVQTVLSDLLQAIGRRKLSVLLDDVHAIYNEMIIELLTAWVTVCPANISLLMTSRHELWNSLFRLKMSGSITEFTRKDLSFSRKEAEKLWGFFDEDIYTATEGWSLAIQSYRLATKNDQTLTVSRLDAEHDLYRYLLHTILLHLPQQYQYFLKATSYLPVLVAEECDALFGNERSLEILEYLLCHNIFTSRLDVGTYRYHALFHLFLQQNDDGLGRETLRRAMMLKFKNNEYEPAADYAMLLQDSSIVSDCIERILCKPFSWVQNRNLQKYFDFLELQSAPLPPRVMLAKGMLLSDQGDFYQAEKYLSAAIPHLGEDEKNLYLYSMTHMARVLRNKVSFEESNRCLNTLLPLLQDAPMQDWYSVMIEKIHLLTLTSHFYEALELTERMMTRCLSTGAIDIKAWFERYLTAIYFYMGDYESCVKAYEKSLLISDEQQDYLMRHSISAYAAKAYQITGREEKTLPLLSAELNRLKHLGLYEEYSINYLIHAEVLHSMELLKCYQGQPYDFAVVDFYLEMAEKYAVLNRSTRDHYLFVKIWKLCSLLIEQPDKAADSIQETLSLLESTTPFFQSLAYGRMANALDTLKMKPEQCKYFFHESIRIGELNRCYAYATIAYGRLAAIYLREGNLDKAAENTRRFLMLSEKFNHRYYIRFRPLFDSVLKLAKELGIAPDFTRDMMSYGGYTSERVYIHTLGAFYIAPVHDRKKPVKIRTQKARELLAYLLEHRNGVSREQIYADLWEDSDADVTRLFHTRRGEIRRAFESLGAENPIFHVEGLYRLNMAEILCDYDMFQKVSAEFQQQSASESAKKLVDCYTGRYLDDLEALWAESTRLSLEDNFLEAAETLITYYRNQGERGKSIELLRRCTGSSYPVPRN